MKTVAIRHAKTRQIRKIPIDQIVMVHTRNRVKQLNGKVRSIVAPGLWRPILVNARNYAQKQKYELICGEMCLLTVRA